MRKMQLLQRFFAFEWRRRVHSLAAMLIILQFLELFAKSWWPETMQSVKMALIAAVVFDLAFPRLRVWQRFAAAILLAVSAAGIALRLDVSEILFVNWHEFWRSLAGLAGGLHPVVWFPLGCCAGYRVIADYGRNRGEIISIIVCSTIALAIVDSFSKLILWNNVAVIILCGLALLVVEHSEYMQRRHAESWKYVTEYPGTLLTTLTAIALVLAIAAYAAPNTRPLVTDPYTAWKNAQGEEVFSAGKSLLSISLGSPAKSGYERDSELLGGAFDFDYSPVMTVAADHKSYWRGEVRTIYTGKGWKSAGEESRVALPVAPGGQLAQFGAAQTSAETVTNRQTVTMLRDEQFPVLFGAFPVTSVESMNSGGNDGSTGDFGKLRWYAPDGELRWIDPAAKSYPPQYTLISSIPVIDEDKLRQAADSSMAETFSAYTQLPQELPERVKQLAATITANAANPYDKVNAIVAYLQETYPYNTKPDTSKAKSADFVDSFLFEVKEGYCDYYSTAMVVLVRSLGIPARWVKGYSSGSPEMEEEWGNIPRQILEQMDAGVYTVRNSDAHSWVEVYFSGSGWLPFEPTAGFTMPMQIAQQAEGSLPETDVSPSAAEHTNKTPVVVSWLVGPAVALLALVAIALVGRRFGLFGALLARLPRREKKLANQQALAEISRLFRYLARKGYMHREHETLRETVARWGFDDVPLRQDLAVLVAAAEKAKFSRAGISADEADDVQTIVRNVREKFKMKRR